MNIGDVGTAFGIICAIGYGVYRVLRWVLLEEINQKTDRLVKIMVKDKEELQEKIDTGDKYIIKYVGNACDEKLKNYEDQNEKIRQVRQKGHDDNFSSIIFSLDKIRESLDRLQTDFRSYGDKITTHENEIKNIKENIREIRKAN